ncbi:MAG: aconitase X swivel domain-containing protein [Acidimicrobiales bacterium]
MSELGGIWLVEAPIRGEVLRLQEPLSFWGGFDAGTGRVIDRAHPQHGSVLTDKVVAIPGSKGSSGTPGVLGDSIRRGTGPHALVITKADINLVAGALAASALYDRRCAILLVTDDVFDSLRDGEIVTATPTSGC